MSDIVCNKAEIIWENLSGKNDSSKDGFVILIEKYYWWCVLITEHEMINDFNTIQFIILILTWIKQKVSFVWTNLYHIGI